MDFLQSFRTLPAGQLSAFGILSLLWPVHGPKNFVEMFSLLELSQLSFITVYSVFKESRWNPFSSTIFAKPSIPAFCWLAVIGFKSDFSPWKKHKGFLLSV